MSVQMIAQMSKQAPNLIFEPSRHGELEFIKIKGFRTHRIRNNSGGFRQIYKFTDAPYVLKYDKPQQPGLGSGYGALHKQTAKEINIYNKCLLNPQFHKYLSILPIRVNYGYFEDRAWALYKKYNFRRTLNPERLSVSPKLFQARINLIEKLAKDFGLNDFNCDGDYYRGNAIQVDKETNLPLLIDFGA